jgi:hypothetical protein
MKGKKIREKVRRVKIDLHKAKRGTGEKIIRVK